MNNKLLFFASILTNVVMLVLIFVVKKSATSQAQEHVKTTLERSNYQMAQVRDNIENNNVLWSIIDSTWKSPDKSRAAIKRLADSQKLPRCNGKVCAGNEDEARLRTNIVSNAEERSITVGWGSSGKTSIKYSFKVFYDNRDRFVTIDASDLLGKSVPVGAEIEEEEAAE